MSLAGGRLAGPIALLLLVGCATPGLPPIAPDDPRPAALLARFTADRAERRALRGRARLAVDAQDPSGDVRVRSKQRVVLARPARLRVEVQGLLGATLAVLAVDEHEYAFFEVEGRHYESGPVHPDLLWNVVRLDLTPAEAVGLLLGAPDLPAGLRILSAREAGGGRVALSLGRADGLLLREVELDDEGRLRRYAVHPDRAADRSGALWTAVLDDYAQVDGVPLAHRVSVETRSGARAVVSLGGVELNPPLSPDIFRIEGLGPAASAGEGG